MSENTPRSAGSKQRWLPLTSLPTTPVALPMRPALAELPALPMGQRPQLSTSKTLPTEIPVVRTNQPLTPPSTPPKPENTRASASADGIEAILPIEANVGVKPSEMPKFSASQASQQEILRPESALKAYTARYQLHEELGRGAWSTVYLAVENAGPLKPQTNLPPTPPTSPTTGTTAPSKKVLAVKKPTSRQAHKILEKEAKILTYIHSHADASTYLVLFHGFDTAQHSIVLGAVPLSLETHAKAAARSPLSIKTMFDPVLGAEEWAGLAEGLIGGLAFLHGIGCVHGDIKPANVLLRSESSGELSPMYCDFSSSHIISGMGEEKETEEVSAVTTEYLSPELLEALSPRSAHRAVATFASDVFALAVTLLFAATGDSPYAGARIASQKLGMAKEGVPFEFARRGDQASRIMKGRAVEKALKGALAKEAEKRVTVAEWRGGIREVVECWKEGGWARGG